MVAAVDFGVAPKAVGEDRARGLIVERREVAMTCRAVLLRRRLLQHASIGTAVRDMTDDAAIAPASLVREYKRPGIARMAPGAGPLAQVQIAYANTLAMHVMARTATHAALGHGMVVWQRELGGDAGMTVGAGALGVLRRTNGLGTVQRPVTIGACDLGALVHTVLDSRELCFAAMAGKARIGLLRGVLATAPRNERARTAASCMRLPPRVA
jgi:hypothetical protein